MVETINLHIQNVQYTSSRIKLTRIWTHHCQKLKTEIILKTATGNRLIVYRESSLGLKADFSSEAMEAKWHWDDISKVLKEKSIKKESDIQQNYSLKEKLRYFPKNKN